MQTGFRYLLSVCVLLFAQSAKLSATESEPCTLTTNGEAWPPFVDKTDGKMSGMDVEIIEFVAKEAGCKVVWKEMIWKRALQLLQMGKLAFVSGASITEERKKWGHFIPTSYRYETMSLFVRKDEAKKLDFKNISDIYQAKNFVLGITLDYFYGQEFNNLLKKYKERVASKKKEISDGIIIKEVNQDDKNYTKLVGRHKRITGFIGEKMATIRGLKDKNLLNKVEIHPLKINEDEVFILFSKKFLESFKGTKHADVADKIDQIVKKHRWTKIQNIIASYEK